MLRDFGNLGVLKLDPAPSIRDLALIGLFVKQYWNKFWENWNLEFFINRFLIFDMLNVLD